ncbi:hypothetical protein EMPS_11530 [Entomortierella parvispora]|uniref:NAD(P)-binding domain-containing protein n=1 Tax=Entomortierella parvispora TaxID=205924 RepID=A0A9P3HM35_9FUNG|nr:hypothetical protein EMPS_11530 [Entomortierella parvispora]
MTPSPPVEPTLAITACDTYTGQRLALQLAEYLSKHHRSPSNDQATDTVPTELVCLARNPDKCGLLQKKKNVKVVKISYDDPTSLALAIRGITTVVLVPEIEPQRLDWINTMVDIFKQEQVVRCVVISCIGTDAPEKSELDAFRRMEESVTSNIQRWTVLREGFRFQTLFYWISMVQDQGVLGMPIKKEATYSPLDIIDLGHALIVIVFPPENDSGAHHDGQTYTLTGPETVNGPKLSDELSKALTPMKGKPSNPPEVPSPIVYKETSKDEIRRYLVSLREKSPTTSTFSDGFKLVTKIQEDEVATTQSIFQRISGFFQKENWRKGVGSTLDQSSSADDENKYEAKDLNCGDDPCKCPPRKDPRGKKPPPKEKDPELEAPNDTEVEFLLQLMEYIHEERATFQSGDLKKITGRKGVDAHVFFAKHARDFRSRSSLDTESAATVIEDTFPKTLKK